MELEQAGTQLLGGLPAPHLVRDIGDEAQLRPLLVLGEDVALFRRGEAALRRKRKLLERDQLRRLHHALPDVAPGLQRARLRRDKTEHDDLVALGQEAQRLEAARAVGIVFEEIAVVIDARQQRFGHRLVTAR